MRKLILMIGISLVLLAGCRQQQADLPRLVELDSLIAVAPDSAAALLEAIPDDSLPTAACSGCTYPGPPRRRRTPTSADDPPQCLLLLEGIQQATPSRHPNSCRQRGEGATAGNCLPVIPHWACG